MSGTPAELRGIDPEPDQSFRLAVGGYTGFVAAGYLVVGAVLSGVQSPLELSGLGVAAAIVGGMAGALGTARWRYGPQRLGGSVRLSAVLLPSAGLLLGTVAAWLTNAGAAVVTSGVFATALTASFAFFLVMMVRTRFVATYYPPSGAAIAWRATPSEPARRNRFALAAIILVGTVLFLITGVVLAFNYQFLAPFFGGLGGSLIGMAVRNDLFRVHEAGLAIEHAAAHRFIPWERFDGYRVTDDELRLVHSWRFDHRHDLAEIEDVQAVLDSLDDHLPCLADDRTRAV
jgi:hypothetical protein